MLLRLEYMLEKYIAGLPFKDCLVVDEHTKDRILTYKTSETISLAIVIKESDRAYHNIKTMSDCLLLSENLAENITTVNFINSVVADLIKPSLLKELSE